MLIWTWVVIVAWTSPLLYMVLVVLGEVFSYVRKKKLGVRHNPGSKIDLVIFQIPTVGNFCTVNKIIEDVKEFNLPVKIDYWVIIEESDEHKEEYESDKVIVVPEDFKCNALYKARALEYARRIRMMMVERGEILKNYLVIQCDDDSLPSKDFLYEALKVNADMIVGNISPRPIGFWNTVLDYERCVGCMFFCNFFTNISKPVWGHGEGVVMSSTVDRNISYNITGGVVTPTLFLAEDMLHMHKTALKYPKKIYNSRKPVYITPPQGISDALKQRRRWTWGHICILGHKHLPMSNRSRIAVAEFFGVWVYIAAMFGVPMHNLGLISIPNNLYPLLWVNFLLWLGLRGYSVGQLMGWKHAILAILTSYITVTLNFFVHMTGILQGNPKKFEIIKKTL